MRIFELPPQQENTKGSQVCMVAIKNESVAIKIIFVLKLEMIISLSLCLARVTTFS